MQASSPESGSLLYDKTKLNASGFTILQLSSSGHLSLEPIFSRLASIGRRSPMQSNLSYALIMLSAGIGIPILAALNAALGVRLGSPVAAAVVLFAVAFSCSAVILGIIGPAKLIGVVDAPKYLLLGGTLVAFYILTITWIAPKFGIGNAVFFVLLGQLISAAIIDHFGLLGALPQSISLTRAAGIAIMGLGVFVTQLA